MIIRLGYQHVDEHGQAAVTIGDRIGGAKQGYRLPAHVVELWRSLDGSEPEDTRAPEEQKIINTLIRSLLACSIGGSLAEGYGIVPVQRKALKVVEVLEEGYTFMVDDGLAFDLDEWPARFITLMDGRSTLGEIALSVLDRGRQDSGDSQIVRDWETRTGRDFEDYLAEAALQFITAALATDAISFEPPSPTSMTIGPALAVHGVSHEHASIDGGDQR